MIDKRLDEIRQRCNAYTRYCEKHDARSIHCFGIEAGDKLFENAHSDLVFLLDAVANLKKAADFYENNVQITDEFMAEFERIREENIELKKAVNAAYRIASHEPEDQEKYIESQIEELRDLQKENKKLKEVGEKLYEQLDYNSGMCILKEPVKESLALWRALRACS